VIDFTLRELTLDGQPVKLTPTEYNLLYHLVCNEGTVMPQRRLLQKVVGKEYLEPSDLKKYIQRLREKLKDDPSNPPMLLTECGVGCKFIRPR
jgi:two-component system KDP operon response regulator KdpE